MRLIERVIFNLAHEIQRPGFVLLYQHLMRHQWKSREELVHEQTKKLRDMIRFCYDYIPYYRKKFKMINLYPSDIKEISDLKKIPPINKKEIISNKEDFYPRGLRIKFDTSTTGGTTGTPLSFRVSRYVRFLSAALRYRSWSAGGYHLGDRILFFAGSSLIPNKSKSLSKFANEMGRNLRSVSSFNISTTTLDYCVEQINTWKPLFLRGYPSSIVELANHVERKNLNLHQLKAIFTTSETLFPHVRESIESTLKAKVYDGYGAGDGGLQSFECEHKRMHICTERSVLEVVNDSNCPIVGEVGRILATDLENYAMPLIRYDLGDDAVASEDSCTCGRGLPLLDSLIGRTVSVFVTPQGKLIHGWFFLYMFWEFGERVRDYKVTQINEYNIEILVVPGSNFTPSILTTIEEYIHSNCVDWIVEINLVEEIPKTSSGKKIFIESNVKGRKAN